LIPLFPYKEYLETVYHSKFIISDSGTGQEEPALLGTKVVVPRDFTERPQSYTGNCSIQLKLEGDLNSESVFEWIENEELQIETSWLGEGNTSKLIIEGIKDFFTRS
jgi:UDP-N-acetylglucosamine 2-epimerase